MNSPCANPVEISRNAGQEHRPAAGREVHRASRRGRFTQQEIKPEDLFRVLCALIERELRAHRDLNFGTGYIALAEHMKCAAARAHLPYGAGSPFWRALDAVEAARRPKHRAATAAAPQAHWRTRCEQRGHVRWCQTPVQCELRRAKEERR